MDNLQETFNRLYEQKKQEERKKLLIRGTVIMTQKEITRLNKSKNDIVLVS